jgi:hypothetical protein
MHALGVTYGPPSPITQQPTTFQIVFGLFDEDENQMVHAMSDGSQIPIVMLSNSLPIETQTPKLIVQ